MIKLITLLMLIAYSTACGGGGFFIIDETNAELADGAKVSNERYLTMQIDFRNKDVLLSDSYRSERDSDFKYIYIFAEFTEPVAGAGAIPLFLIDLSTGAMQETRGAELISKLPLRPEVRGTQFFEIETRALEKSLANVIVDIWSSVEDIVKAAATTISPGTQTALSVVDSAATLLDRVASKERIYAARIAVRRNFNQERLAQVYFLLPTDEEGRVLDSAKRVINQARSAGLTICRNPSGDAFACVGPENQRKSFEDFPYIIFDFRLQQYVEDDALLPRAFGLGCVNLTADRVATARARLGIPGLLHPEQAHEEELIIERADRFLALQRLVQAREFSRAVDAYTDYIEIGIGSGSPVYEYAFKTRTTELAACVQSQLTRIPGNEIIGPMVTLLSVPMNLTSGAEDELQNKLKEIVALIYAVDGDNQGATAFLNETRLYPRALARIRVLERMMYQRFYLPLISRLRSGTGDAPQLVVTLQRKVSDTHCDLCRREGTAAILEYNNKTLAANLASVERDRIQVIEDAATLRSQLEAKNNALDMLNQQRNTEAENAMQRIQALQRALMEQQMSVAEREYQIKILTEEFKRARSFLRD